MEYYILSPKHTSKGDSWITLWRSGSSGYCWRLDWAGKYSEEDARSICADTHGDCVMAPVFEVERWKAKAVYDNNDIEVLPNDRQVRWAFKVDEKAMKPAKYKSV